MCLQRADVGTSTGVCGAADLCFSGATMAAVVSRRLPVYCCFLMLFSKYQGWKEIMEAAGGVITRVKGKGILNSSKHKMQVHMNCEIHTAISYADHKALFCHTFLTRSGLSCLQYLTSCEWKLAFFGKRPFYSLLLCSGRNMHFFSFTTSIFTALMTTACSWNPPAFPKKEIKIAARLSGADEVAAPGHWPLMTASSCLQIQLQSSLQIADKGPPIPSKLKP